MRNDYGDFSRENETARERREHIKKEQNKTKTERKRDGMRRNKPKWRKNGSQRESVIQNEKHKCET